MKHEYKIQEGDTVDVSRNSLLVYANATVLYIPWRTGDSWVFKDQFGDVHYVTEGCTISKKTK